jgi:hypothetical protein
MRSIVIKTILLLNLLILFGPAADVYAGKEFPLLSSNPVERKEAARVCIIIITSVALAFLVLGCIQNSKLRYAIFPAVPAVFVVESLGRWGWGFIKFSIGATIFLSIFLLIRKLRGNAPWYFGFLSRLKTSGIKSLNPWPHHTNTAKSYSLFSTILYHGTPHIDNARDIAEGRGTFLIGSGNAYGTGLYLADLQTATGYAGYMGAILKIKLQIPRNQIVNYTGICFSLRFFFWAIIKGSRNRGDNITNYSLNVLKKRYLRVNQNLYVALCQRTQTDEHVIFPGLHVLEVFDPFSNPLSL